MGSPPPPSPVRRSPRSRPDGVNAQARLRRDGSWRDVKLYDLSMGGSLVSTQAAIEKGQRFELKLARDTDGLTLEILVEALRGVQQADGSAVAVRFVELTPAAAKKLMSFLRGDDGQRDAPVDHGAPVPRAPPTQHGQAGDFDVDVSVEEMPELSTLRLHDVSLYDLLELDPQCPDGDLESRCEALIADVARMIEKAVGRREAHLRVLHHSLERMRPLWSNPLKRARYDLRWGYVRAEERLRDAEEGRGLPLHILAAIWHDLYPDNVRAADRLVRKARDREQMRQALARAVTELDPFDRDKRRKLATLDSADLLAAFREHEEADAAEAESAFSPSVTKGTAAPTEPRETAAAEPHMAPPKRAPGSKTSAPTRGSLDDLPLTALLRSLAKDGVEAEVSIRVGTVVVGVIGFNRGDIVICTSGERRGIDALRSLARVIGTFQVSYGTPPKKQWHMRENGVVLVEKAFEEPR